MLQCQGRNLAAKDKGGTSDPVGRLSRRGTLLICIRRVQRC